MPVDSRKKSFNLKMLCLILITLFSLNVIHQAFSNSTIPQSNGGVPFYIYIIIAVIIVILIGGYAYLYLRGKRMKVLSEKKDIYRHIDSIYRSVISIKKIMIVHIETSLPIYEMDFGSEIAVDPSLISGFLQAVSTIGGEMIGRDDGGVKRIDYQNFTVTSTQSGNFIIHTFSDVELYELIEDRLSEIAKWFSLMFGSLVEDWDGSTEIFRLNKEGIKEKIMGDIFLWLFYPLVITTKGEENLENMEALEKKIFKFIQESDSSTISRILDILDDLGLDETLIVLFDLVDKGYIKPNYGAYDIVTIRF